MSLAPEQKGLEQRIGDVLEKDKIGSMLNNKDLYLFAIHAITDRLKTIDLMKDENGRYVRMAISVRFKAHTLQELIL